ncbi:SPV083 mutT motif [Swinepox virus]|uniref:SPV083 mutT motif n=1 Tax=Swinepox virus (strain Swine/Nebraska/17077-99/1999) TaxID=300880 RepID=Q8V3L2_SWPV1|nr:SPV083 mutT motif [Swinepox virus]AAL69822.1 SPV083 mutT motif [Swinepox virus]UED36769.1 SPV083 mutT motif [Swinepox virus]UUA44273.1 SPV083 [Swinepox virus]
MVTPTLFETDREVICIEDTDNIQHNKNTHVFAICITSDNKPIVAARRSSFVFQETMSQRTSPTSTLKVSKHLLKYMYPNEIKEIFRRLQKGSINDRYILSNCFEEIILLGGRLNKSESINDCLYREIREESDSKISIKHISNKFLKLTIFDKLFNKTYISYCTICYINESLYESTSSRIYNVEIRGLRSLLDCRNNDKYKYLLFIYNTLVNTK